ncbi:staygreen family protein [Clostridium oryzae]|uniref:Staygreen protein n=1 Tax=Clostridium oryzae TaxID=1450648 RepID=A0A1V4ILF4_9CLOT|nr:staygreen family protein [Clostridium oryzae]OPJ60766.1 staygreen protein [Clostridium oryzae]
MSTFDPNKLSVEFKSGVTPTEPIIPRLYTLTHSDITAELFLTIAPYYDFDKLTLMRDEVLCRWIKTPIGYYFYVQLHLDSETGNPSTEIRNSIFVRELPLALQAIRYGDRYFFDAHTKLDGAPIIVYFHSEDANYNRVENWGTFSDYTL